MPKLETLELEIVQSSKTSTTGVKNLATALSGLATAGKDAESLGNVAKHLSEIATAANGLKEASSGIRSVANAMKKLSETLSAAPGSVTGLQRIAEAMGKISEAAGGLSGTASDIREIRKATKAVGGVGSVTATANGEAEPATFGSNGEATIALDEFAQKAKESSQRAEAFKATLRSVGSAAANMGKRLASISWNNFKKRIKESVGGLSQLFAAFKRIAMYRALRTAIKMITQGFATGVKHLYAWADLVGNSFKGSMDSLATSSNYLKNSLGAMVSPIIDALAPAVEILVEKFVGLINVVNQFLATVTGASSWRRAVRQQKEYEENTNDAAAAQKRLNHQLMAFDELNNITLNNPSGRGSGNKDDEVDDKSFVEEQLPDWAKDIKDAINKGNWYEAGSLLANKLNSLIDNWDAADWGKKIGQKISNGLSFYNGLMDNTNWKGLGGKVADWLDAVIENVPGEDLGHAIVATFNAAIGFLAGFTGNFDWSAAGTWLADVLIGAITGINWKNAGELVGNLATGLLNMIEAAFDELANNSGKVLGIIGDFFSGLWGEDGSGLLSVIKIGGLVLAWKSVMSSVFGNKGLANTVKTSFGTLLEKAGLSGVSGGFMISALVGLAWATGGIVDNIKKYGFDKGMWASMSVMTPEITAKLGLDYEDFMHSFSDAFSAVSPLLKALGIEVPDLPQTSKNKQTKKSTNGGGANAGGPTWSAGYIKALGTISKEAEMADKKIALIAPSTGNKRAFLAATDSYTNNVKEIGTAASNSTNKINKMPTSKKFKFTDVSGGLGKAANYASAFVESESKFKEKYTFTVDASELGDAASDAQKLYQNLNNINNKSWKVQVTGDMKLKMVSERGNTMYFVQPEANGGFPATGQLFIANEAGPELIGTVNGHTAVSSNQEITGIANAVYETGEDEAALLREQNQLLRQLLAKQTTVSLAPNVAAGRWVAQASNAYRKATGG